MSELNKGAGADMPAGDRALDALASELEMLGEQAGEAFVHNRPGDERTFEACQARAACVVRAIVSLPSLTLHGASAKARAARASVAMALLPPELVDVLGIDMHGDVCRLRGEEGAAGHA